MTDSRCEDRRKRDAVEEDVEGLASGRAEGNMQGLALGGAARPTGRAMPPRTGARISATGGTR